MSKQNAHPWKAGGSWTCSQCGYPVYFCPVQDKQDGVCADCAEKSQDCKEWGDAIAAKNGK